MKPCLFSISYAGLWGQASISLTDFIARAASVKKLRIEVGRLEEEVSKFEAKQNELIAALEAPETYHEPGKAQHLNRELSVVVDQLTAATADWEKAASELAELEKL